MSAVDTLRNALFGNPPSSSTEPSREGVLAAFTELQRETVGAVSGLKFYATKAALDADTTQPPGTLAYVYDDATPANNTIYHYETGGWVIDDAYFEGVASVVQPQIDDVLAKLASLPPIKQFPNNSQMDGGVGRFIDAATIQGTDDAVFRRLGAIFEAVIAPGTNGPTWLCQFGTDPVLPGGYVAVSVLVRIAAGQPWPVGKMRVTLDPVTPMALTEYEQFDATHRRYHGVIRNTTDAKIDQSAIQIGNTGTAPLYTTLYVHGASYYPITDVDWSDVDPFNTRQQDRRLDALESPLSARSALIVGAGDSHTNGQILRAEAADYPALAVGIPGVASALDTTLGLTGEDGYFRGDCQIGSTTTPNASNDQGFSAVGTGRASWLSYLPAVIRPAMPKLGKLVVANVAVGGSAIYSWAGEQAFGFVRALALPLDGDTVTIAGQAYAFRTNPTAAYDVLIAATPNGCILNLQNAVNSEGSGYGPGTPGNTQAWGASPVAGEFGRFNALETGTAGNALTIASSSTSRITAVNASNAPVSSVNFRGGSATSAIYANAKAALGGRIPDVWTFTLGTNDAIRVGYRGRKSFLELQRLIDRIRADYPSAKIVLMRPFVTGVGEAAAQAMANQVVPAIDNLANTRPDYVSAADLYSLGAGTGDTRILNPVDGIHGTPYAYGLLAQLAGRKIVAALS